MILWKGRICMFTRLNTTAEYGERKTQSFFTVPFVQARIIPISKLQVVVYCSEA